MENQDNRILYGVVGLISLIGFAVIFWINYGQAASSGVGSLTAWLPALNASLNAISACLLIVGRIAIAMGRTRLHKRMMISALAVSGLFLASYLYYHYAHGDTRFLGQGWIRPVYFFVLISHILLSMAAFPMVLLTLTFALTARWAQHRRLARFTFPIWLYVSITGVMVFLLLRGDS